MADPRVTCPKCGHRFPLTKALTGQVEESLRLEYDTLAKQRERETELRYRKRAEADRRVLQRQAAAKAAKAASAQLAALRSQIALATKREKATRASSERSIATARAQAQREAQKEATARFAAQVADLTKKLEEGQARLKDTELRERASLQKEAALKAEEDRLHKTIEREVAAARKKAAAETAKEVEETYLHRELEHQKVRDDLMKQLTDARRRLAQSSQQLQGEVRELELEKALVVACPGDKISAVRKGKLGADIIHKVVGPGGNECGKIVWEVKNARTWTQTWITKLRSDQRRENAELAVLVSNVLPKNAKSHLSQAGGVWVCDNSVAPGLAVVLRANLVELARVRGSARGKPEKMEMLYQYLMSTEFRQRVEAIVEGFVGMRDDLEREKTASEKAWAKREKELDQVLENVAGMVGDIQAVAPAFPKIRRLELPAPAR
jgi:hypothetical protein